MMAVKIVLVRRMLQLMRSKTCPAYALVETHLLPAIEVYEYYD
jgi:hypothetical protein